MNERTSSAAALASGGEALLALKNALKLGGSLLCTWGIALMVRLLVPRLLGTNLFAPVKFADELALMCMAVLGLGLETYIRKEVSVRFELASRFFAGVVLLRALGALAVLALMHAFLELTDRPRDVRLLVYIFALAQFFLATNQSLAAMLQARGTVDGLSVANVASKLVWGAGIAATVGLSWPLWGVPASLLASEVVKTAACWKLVRRHLDVRWNVDLTAVKLAIVASLPFYLNQLAQTVYNKLDVSLIELAASRDEVAWYGAASTLGDVTLLVSPIIGWVLMPMFARAKARSDEEYAHALRRSLELVLVIAIPTALFMAVGADVWVRLLFGEAYLPASTAVRFLAPLFVFTYVAMVSSNALVLADRAWTLAAVSISGMVLNPLLNWYLIPAGMRWFAVAGAGTGAAIAQLLTEIAVTLALILLIGWRAFDRRSTTMLAKTALACAAVVATDRALLSLGAARLVADVAVYLAVVVGTGAVNLRESYELVQSAIKRRTAAAN